MDNLEGILQCLNEFDQTADKSVSPELEQLLEHIAKTGRTVFPWHLLKPLISFKLEKVLNDFFESSSTNSYISEPTTKSQEFLPIVEKLVSNLNCFSGTPFTIQRLCELITQPRQHYKASDKFLRGVEKNIMVVSTVQPDGSLITRSVNTILTNGAISPTKSVPVNTTPAPANNPSHNSPLNTNFQENGSNSHLSSAAPPSDEKPQTILVQDHLSAQMNGAQNGDSTEKQSDVDGKCTENSDTKKDIASFEKPVSTSAAVNDGLQENVEDNSEKQNEVPTTEKLSQGETDEKPSDEKTEDQTDEKMDES